MFIGFLGEPAQPVACKSEPSVFILYSSLNSHTEFSYDENIH